MLNLLLRRYSSQMSELFTEVYNLLPLCHCINDKILVRYFERFGGCSNCNTVKLIKRETSF